MRCLFVWWFLCLFLVLVFVCVCVFASFITGFFLFFFYNWESQECALLFFIAVHLPAAMSF